MHTAENVVNKYGAWGVLYLHLATDTSKSTPQRAVYNKAAPVITSSTWRDLSGDFQSSAPLTMLSSLHRQIVALFKDTNTFEREKKNMKIPIKKSQCRKRSDVSLGNTTW